MPSKKLRHIFKKLEIDEILALGRAEKSLLINFEHYDFTNGGEFLHEIWCTCTPLSYVEDPTVLYLQRGSKAE